jgi:alpha-glucoside transport system substrate-binding protein
MAPRTTIAFAGMIGLSLALAACGGDGSTGTSGGNGSTKADCASYSQYGDLSGKSVSIYTSIVAPEDQPQIDSYKPFEECTGAKIKYEGSKEFEAQLPVRVKSGNPPDIAFVPQPGLLKTLVETGKVKAAPDSVSKAVDENWSKDWKNYGTFDGTFYSAPKLANLKGYIWYSPAKFKEWGVEVPKTWDEMMTLTDTIKQKSGEKPWCVGFASGDASGWPGTDWIEDLVLRQSGPEVYDKWVSGDVKFTDPEIKDAFDAVGSIILNPDYVNAGFGDVKSINATAFGDVAAKVADGTCALTHQASFLSANFLDVKNAAGETPTVAPDGDVYAFIMPGMKEGELSVEGGGEFVAGFNTDPSTVKVLEFMASPEFADARVKLGGVISANKKADPSNASSQFLQEAMGIIQDDKTTFRFDASDLMPSTVGSGSFWKGMVDWVDGKSTDEVLSNIQAGYEN